jgi:hypothetical protein
MRIFARWMVLWAVLLVLSLMPAATSAQPDPRLLQPDDLVYLGAFRLPDEPLDAWAYSGAALAYYTGGDPDGAGDGFPGSLFATGHNWYQQVAELSIPAPGLGPVDSLPVAATLQPLTDLRGDRYPELEIPRAGLAYLPPLGEQTTGKLYYAWAQHMGEGDTLPTHGWAETNLADPQVAGPWRVGDTPNYVTGDYLFDIPLDWAKQYVNGMALATGRFRDGGQGSLGPTLLAIAPWQAGNPPEAGSTIPATPLLLYGSVYEGEDAPALDGYCPADEWSGAAWLTAGERAAVIFVGTKGTGACWYGCSDGTVWEEPYPESCGEDGRGWWSTSFAGQMLFYDPDDFAAVAAGMMEAWEPQPYAVLDLDAILYHIEAEQQLFHVGAAAFDREHGLLYVMEPFADGDKPVVHVWRVG